MTMSPKSNSHRSNVKKLKPDPSWRCSAMILHSFALSAWSYRRKQRGG